MCLTWSDSGKLFFLCQTSPLTSQQLERIRPGTLFWSSPPQVLFFFFSQFLFPVESQNNRHCTYATRVFVCFGGVFLYQWAASGTPWGWWGGGGVTVRVFFFCRITELPGHDTRTWCLYAANGVTRTSESIQRNNLSKGNIISWWISSDLIWDTAIDVLPAERGKLSFACFCNLMWNSRRQIRFFSPPQLSGSNDCVLMQEGYTFPLLIYLYCPSKLLCLYFYNLKAQCVRFSSL